jgi:hypothetical protein
MTPCEDCHRLERLLHHSTDIVWYVASHAARVKGRKAKENAVARVGQAQKERNEAGKLWAEHCKSHEGMSDGLLQTIRLEARL